jgi:tetratricopeptide (TPR) repeat protein
VFFESDASSEKSTGARQAYEQFQAAGKSDEKSISPDLAVGLLYEEAKLHDKAQKFIARSVTNLPKDSAMKMSTIFAAGRWALDTEQYHEASDYADVALKLDPKSQDAKFLKAVAARMLGDIKTAERCLEEINTAAPENFSASNQLAQVLAEQNDKEKRERALQIATINQRIHGQDHQNPSQAVESATTLGWVYYQMQRTAEATQALQAVANAGNPSSDSLYFMARLIQDRGDNAGALNLLNAALSSGHSFIHRKEAQEMHARLANQAGGGKQTTTDPPTPLNATPKKPDAAPDRGDSPVAPPGAAIK